MTRTVWVVSLLSLLASTLLLSGCWEKSKNTAWSNATGAESYERLMWDDVKHKNWSSVEQHLGASFIMTMPSGTYSRSATMEYLQSRIALDDYSMGDVAVTPNGNDMVVTYTMTLHGSDGGRPMSGEPLHMMTVWQQVKHGWIAIAHSVTPASRAEASR